VVNSYATIAIPVHAVVLGEWAWWANPPVVVVHGVGGSEWRDYKVFFVLGDVLCVAVNGEEVGYVAG
jgi:hypothetical protein